MALLVLLGGMFSFCPTPGSVSVESSPSPASASWACMLALRLADWGRVTVVGEGGGGLPGSEGRLLESRLQE